MGRNDRIDILRRWDSSLIYSVCLSFKFIHEKDGKADEMWLNFTAYLSPSWTPEVWKALQYMLSMSKLTLKSSCLLWTDSGMSMFGGLQHPMNTDAYNGVLL